jgi:glycine/D-amino acid oxidase-like deaminating enzyme
MLDWLVIGGGLHGTHISHYLIATGKASPDRVRVLDPYEQPLARWDECTANTGMKFLRSPVVHHLAVDPYDLQEFVKTPPGCHLEEFTEPYQRPSLRLFRAHTEALLKKHRLRALRIQGRAASLQRCTGGLRVETARGELKARRVVLAISLSEQPEWPGWAERIRAIGGRIHHIFDPGFKRAELTDWAHCVVVGGGITAAQTALALAQRKPGHVTLLQRHEVRLHQFDSDPGWVGPKFMDGFSQTRDFAERRRMIAAARHRGSLPPDVTAELKSAVESGRLQHRITTAIGATWNQARGIEFHLGDDARRKPRLKSDCVVLATGFATSRPGGEWLENAIHDLDLPCGECGYPLVNRQLRWHAGLYVTGPLAELELGPTARNITGARRAAERLAGLG